MLDACRAELRARGVEFWAAEVVESNPDVRLYERAGFRPNYRKLFGRAIFSDLLAVGNEARRGPM